MEGLVNFFRGAWEAITGFVGSILGHFGSVAEAVIGLGLMPLASILGAVLNVGINAICDLMARITDGTMGLFALDIGSGRSTFEQAIGGLSWITPVMRAMGMTLLFFIVLTNLVKVMTTPTENTETPGRILFSATVAGVLIYLGPQAVIYIQRLFNLAYMAVFSMFDLSQMDFSGFTRHVQDYVTSSGHFDVGGNLATSQINALTSTLFVFLIILIIFVVYVKFMLEVAQRYVVVGALVLTAPIAFALAGAQSTRGSFKRWVRMVGCQFILMISSVMFLAVFFFALDNIDQAFASLPDNGGVTVVVLWGILVYGLLHVGMAFDSYLKSLGFSIAETGAGALTSLAYDMIEMGEIFAPGRHGQGAGRYTTRASGGGRLRGMIGERIQERRARQGSPPDKIFQPDMRTGLPSISSVVQAAKQMERGYLAKGADIGQSVISNVRGIPDRIRGQLDTKTCSVQNGCIRMSTVSSNKGERLILDMIPAESAVQKGITEYGRPINIGGEEFLAVPHGEPELVHQFLRHNPGARQALANRLAGEVKPILDTKNRETGCYRIVLGAANSGPATTTAASHRDASQIVGGYPAPSANGTTGTTNAPTTGTTNAPTTGTTSESYSPSIETVHEWVPVSCYRPDIGLGAKKERVRGMEYYHYEVPMVRGPDGALSGWCEPRNVPAGNAERAVWLQSQFPELAGRGYQVAGQQQDGVVMLHSGAGPKYLAPVSDFTLEPDADAQSQRFELVYAANGTRHIMVEVSGQAERIPLVRRPSSASDEAPLASETARAVDAFADLLLDTAPGIIQYAQERKKKRK